MSVIILQMFQDSYILSYKKSYYVSFTDDYSRESVIYLISSKDQVFSRYKEYKAMMLRQQDICI